MELLEALRKSGLRITEGRKIVVEVLEEFLKRGEHPTFNMIVNEVKSRRPNTSVSTIYSTLRALESNGSITSFKIGNETVYDRPDPHINIVCIDTGMIKDLELPTYKAFLDDLKMKGFEPRGVIIYAKCSGAKDLEGRPS